MHGLIWNHVGCPKLQTVLAVAVVWLAVFQVLAALRLRREVRALKAFVSDTWNPVSRDVAEVRRGLDDVRQARRRSHDECWRIADLMRRDLGYLATSLGDAAQALKAGAGAVRCVATRLDPDEPDGVDG